MGDRLNRPEQLKPAMYLRGVAQILQDLVLGPDLARAVVERIQASYLGYAERIFAAVRPLIPDLISCGLDVLQSLQPEADGMEPAALKRDFGDRLAFHGGLSIQRTLPCGSPDDVRAEMEGCIRAMNGLGSAVRCRESRSRQIRWSGCRPWGASAGSR